MTIKTLIHKISNKWKKLRLQPIRVFCFHHVCAQYDEKIMYRPDWLCIEDFKRRILSLQRSGMRFISMSECMEHIECDWVRGEKYAVITFDDGFASLKEVLPWLREKNIPVTLFINGYVLDGKSYRYNPAERYLTQEELFALDYPMIEIGHHGWDHRDLKNMTIEDFEQSIRKNDEVIKHHPRFVPFWAYTYGSYSTESNALLTQYGYTPVLMDGGKNYNEKSLIHREL